MIRVARVSSGAARERSIDDTVFLDHDLRHRRRIVLRGEGGTEFLLDLAEAGVLGDGDTLILEDGRVVAVKAAVEPLAEIVADDPAALARIAWHIGNRHLPAAISADRLLIRRDHVIEEMVRGLGAQVRHVDEPFEPEGGAYVRAHAAGPAGQDHHAHDDHDRHGDGHEHRHG
jgi:urease accessory protein